MLLVKVSCNAFQYLFWTQNSVHVILFIKIGDHFNLYENGVYKNSMNLMLSNNNGIFLIIYMNFLKKFHDNQRLSRKLINLQITIMINYCRYKFHFPFLKTKGIVSVEDNRVGPLYKHVFPPQLAPRLSFIGLPQKVSFLNFFFC